MGRELWIFVQKYSFSFLEDEEWKLDIDTAHLFKNRLLDDAKDQD